MKKRPKNKDRQRTNRQIRSPKVRLIGPDGKMIGLVKTEEALKKAEAAGLDLVELGKNNGETIAKITDYSKHRYQKQQAEKKAKKNQKKQSTPEIKLRPNTADHDYNFKLNNIKKLLEKNGKVKVTVAFRGREMEHKDLGLSMLERIKKDLGADVTIEKDPVLVGRSISMIIG